MTDDPSGRLIALRDQLLALPTFSQKVYANLHDHSGRFLTTVDRQSVLAAVDGLITALLRPPREEKKEEATTDDPRNPASVVRSETEPTR